MKGKVILVGAGPGDPGLLTLRGQAALRQADVVVTDALVNPRLWENLSARIIDVGKRGPGAPHGAHQREPQSEINRVLVRLAKQGRNVVRLKGGDPFVFGRGSEELEALRRAKIPFEVVPGVSSAHAVPAYAGIPITDRRFASQVTFLTGHEKGEPDSDGNIDWDRLSPKGTLVILMGVSRWPDLQNQLLKRHWPSSQPVAAIEWGTTVRQRVIYSRLGAAARDFQKQQLRAPAIVVVGRVAALGKKLEWYRRNRPLLGARVIVMRPANQAAELIQALEEKGAQVVHAPAIRIRSLVGGATMQRRLKELQRESAFDFLIFLSANAVRSFAPVAETLAPRLRHAAVAAVGDQTAQTAREFGWRVAITPAAANGRSLVQALGDIVGKRILLPRAKTAPAEILTDFRRRGASVEVLPIYETEAMRFTVAAKREMFFEKSIFVFTSASIVNACLTNFSAAEKRVFLKSARVVSIGAQTGAALRKWNVRRVQQARNATIEELVRAVKRSI